jgi:hypothetical protein
MGRNCRIYCRRWDNGNSTMAHAYSHLYRIPATGLRFFIVYGPWGRPDMARYLFAKLLSRVRRSSSSITERCSAEIAKYQRNLRLSHGLLRSRHRRVDSTWHAWRQRVAS